MVSLASTVSALTPGSFSCVMVYVKLTVGSNASGAAGFTASGLSPDPPVEFHEKAMVCEELSTKPPLSYTYIVTVQDGFLFRKKIGHRIFPPLDPDMMSLP